MAKQKVTTKTSKRYRYSSFKAKIDDLKIEPARNLTKRVHDYVETSHLLASFDHWKEINLSGGFTDFSFEIENLIQTLPLILYHDEKIFTTIIEYIQKHNDKSLQPLLDLLAQFCHDLGPDFMKFYEQAIHVLIELLDVSIKFENTNVFEWGFNCLAYIFKYLWRVLTEDMESTFRLLFPLLSHAKDYLSRFSAEALSFLIRKASAKNLNKLVSYLFAQLAESDEANYNDGLVTLFTESLIAPQEALHSKSNSIFEVLLQEALKPDTSRKGTALICDIWMNLARHTSTENIDSICKFTLDLLDRERNENNLNQVAIILSSIVFAESGKKVHDWLNVTHLVENIIEIASFKTLDAKTCAFLFVVLIRNCDMRNLTKLHLKLFEFYLNIYSSNFLEFYASATNICKERLSTFNGHKYLQKYLDAEIATDAKKVAFFLLEMEDEQENLQNLSITIPDIYVDKLLSSIKNYKSSEDLFEIYWKSILLKYARKTSGSIEIYSIVESILKHYVEPNDFTKDVVGKLLEILSLPNYQTGYEMVQLIKSQIAAYKTSLYFIKGFGSLLDKLKALEGFDYTLNYDMELIENLTTNLTLPDTKVRYETLNLLTKLMSLQNFEIPQLLNDCKIIEEIPLSLDSARDLTVRIRSMGELFRGIEPTSFETSMFLRHLFGLLTVRFSPLWEGVYELLPQIFKSNAALTWNLIMNILTAADKEYNLQYYDEAMQDDIDGEFWKVSVTRLNAAFTSFSHLWSKFSYTSASIIELTKEKRGNMEYPPPIRVQALKIMNLIPILVEQNFVEVAPFFFNENITSELDGVTSNESTTIMSTRKWYEEDKLSLLKIVSKLKNLKTIHRSDEIHDKFTQLLSSANNDIQKVALEGILAYRDQILIKYRDNLRNLLDDKLFGDELTSLFNDDTKQIIQIGDEPKVMPTVLRILFGRAQSANSNGVKKSRKNAVLSILPSLNSEDIIEFFKLGSSRIDYEEFFHNGNTINDDKISVNLLKRMTGFVNIASLSFSTLGSKYPRVIHSIIRPLLYTIAVTNHLSNNPVDDIVMIKINTHLRQLSMKCLNSIFQHMEKTVEWNNDLEDIFNIAIKPRLEKFKDENAQQPSSLMKIIIQWSELENLYPFLYHQNYAAIVALMELLQNPNAKESVVIAILEASNNIVQTPSKSESYIGLVTILASTCLRTLPTLYHRLIDAKAVSAALNILFNLVEAGFVQDDETQQYLVSSLTQILESKMKGLSNQDTIKLLKSLKVLLNNFECEWEKIEDLFKVLSTFFRTFGDRAMRIELVEIFAGFGSKCSQVAQVSQLLKNLNSYSSTHMQEYNFPLLLPAFKELNENGYQHYNELEWLPILNTCLFYVHDKDELALRSNASHTIKKFIDYTNEKSSCEDANTAISLLKSLILPNLRNGLRNQNEEVKGEFISILGYIVSSSKYYKDLADLKILMFNNDEEANFFTNINSIQLHRRQRAVKRLKEFASELADNSISHYLIPIVEFYAFFTEEKYRNISNESLQTIGELCNFISWNQYRALLRRYISLLRTKPDSMKESVLLINQLSVGLKNTLQNMRGVIDTKSKFTETPKLEEIEFFVKSELYPTISKILSVRDDETIVVRTPLAEALVNFVLGLDAESIDGMLPGILTSTCQVLRSKSEELRDAIRKTLAKCAVILGPHYLPFIIKELTSALKRGSQIHVLSFTLHHILQALGDKLGHSDLDASAKLIVSVLMEDIFGMVGQEKESDNYHTKMKEVKVNRSYDTGEILSANISLSTFNVLLHPIKAILSEKINLKNQNRLDELLRRYALGLNQNTEIHNSDALKLCHEIYESSKTPLWTRKNRNIIDEKEEHFLINLNGKSAKVQIESGLYSDTLQKFSLDLLTTILARNKELLTPIYVEGFIPLLKEALQSENEGVLTSTLRILIVTVKIEFSDDSEAIFKNCARKVLKIIQNSPSTTTELCQVGLKFFSSLIRHKDIKMKDAALSYVLGRILPDLHEPSRQGLAFNFLKALVSRHVMLPELYDVIDSTREILVTNHSKEIRDVARSIYYQFLMEYDQSKGRLEKQLKFMVDNLQYPVQDGRQSVMELVNLIVTKGNPILVGKLSSSLFVALANVSVNDDSPKCREMATVLLGNLLSSLDDSNLDVINKYTISWLKQYDNPMFLNLGLRIYKIYLTSKGLGHSKELQQLAITRMKKIIIDTDIGSESQWDAIYVSLSLFNELTDLSSETYTKSFRAIWLKIISCLLYPHSWVRLSALMLISKAIDNLDKFEEKFSNYEIQSIVSKIMHLMSAPSISEAISLNAIKTLVKIGTIWKKNNVKFIPNDSEKGKLDQKYDLAIEYMVSRASGILRSEKNPNDMFVSKKSCVQLLAMLIQVFEEEDLLKMTEKIILPLYNYTEGGEHHRATEEFDELSNLSHDCLQLLEKKISVSAFTKAFSMVKQAVQRRRQERKIKRSTLALNNPDIAAQKKLKKHARSREKRKHEKDENGFYQRKNKQRRT